MKYPFFPIQFDAAGGCTGGSPAELAGWTAAQGIRDLFVFAHGWNTATDDAGNLCRLFFDNLPGGAGVGVAGVFWPSILWPQGGSDRLRTLLAAQPRRESALEEAHGEINSLLPTELRCENYQDAFDALADGAGLDPFRRLWSGAKSALRLTTYYQMKNRAGIIGECGLGPALARVPARIHLLGHSFGARLVSFALRSMPPGTARSLFLLQGAFSHFSFSERGALAGLSKSVDGPLMATHSLRDLAVTAAYPLASIVARQDSSAAVDLLYRWGAMGHDGAQDVGAEPVPLECAATQFSPRVGQWTNFDGNRLIRSHGDIVHSEIAAAAARAAGPVTSAR